MVYFVGAGTGAADLITVRGMRLLQKADVIIYAGSLVNPQLLDYAKKSCEIYNSAKMTLDEVITVMKAAEADGKMTVRLHTGEPSIYGAVREQMDELDALLIPYESCPGVSACFGAAASLNIEYTLPGISQSLIITRMEGRTKVPPKESIASFASHHASMAVYLSTGLLEKLTESLIEGGYAADTPAAIVYKATWPEEKTVRTTVAELAEAAEREHITKTALIVVGNTVAQNGYDRSKLYDPGFTTEFRMAESSHSGKIVSAVPEMAASGKLYVVGMGPGSLDGMTKEAFKAIGDCQVIAGYTVYADLVKPYFPDKEYLTTPMTKEEARCRMAFEC